MSVSETEMTRVQPAQAARPVVWQPRQPVFWLFVALLAAAVPMLVVQITIGSKNVQALLSAVVLLAVQVTLLWLIVRAMPKLKKRQPGSLRLAAFLWGALVAILIAGSANDAAFTVYGQLGLNSLAASLSAPVNEDLVRILGVLLVLTLAMRDRITVMDGVVYGFIVGAGFEVTENLFYALRGDDFLGTVSVGLSRLFVGFGLHALWTTVAGAGLAYCLSRWQRGLPGRWWVIAPTMLLPVLLHAAWDAPSFSIFTILKLLLLLVLYAVTVTAFLLAVRWGRRSDAALLSLPSTGVESAAQRLD